MTESKEKEKTWQKHLKDTLANNTEHPRLERQRHLNTATSGAEEHRAEKHSRFHLEFKNIIRLDRLKNVRLNLQ